jgi:hypothetical protein
LTTEVIFKIKSDLPQKISTTKSTMSVFPRVSPFFLEIVSFCVRFDHCLSNVHKLNCILFALTALTFKFKIVIFEMATNINQ